MADPGHDSAQQPAANRAQHNLEDQLRVVGLSVEVTADLRGVTAYSAEAEARMVKELLALADRDEGAGYFLFATLRHRAELAHPGRWSSTSLEEGYWPRFPLNRVASNYHAIKNQRAAMASAASAEDGVRIAKDGVRIAKDSAESAAASVRIAEDSARSAKLSWIVAAIALLIAFAGVAVQFSAKDPKLDERQVEAIIAAINSAGSRRQDPAQLKLDVAQLHEIVLALAKTGRQEPEAKTAAPQSEKKQGRSASSVETPKLPPPPE